MLTEGRCYLRPADKIWLCACVKESINHRLIAGFYLEIRAIACIYGLGMWFPSTGHAISEHPAQKRCGTEKPWSAIHPLATVRGRWHATFRHSYFFTSAQDLRSDPRLALIRPSTHPLPFSSLNNVVPDEFDFFSPTESIRPIT
ncbi:hypothetical protein A0H81_12141 [Grifola frondosa]|uniref:Uncharacterized protein n=1 Tax=Grifola frondosa TaxID=5627 RepID=A0A1C7LVB5_GRIFR|nr:hypothetical protein A0H81_12141 [Grifola frondosa]